MQYPRSFGDKGWYNFQPGPFNEGALEVYYWSMKAGDRSLVGADPWVRYFSGKGRNKNDGYPVESLRNDLDRVRKRVEGIYADDSAPDMRMSDDMNDLNPASIDALNRLMLGGIPTGRVGYPLHCRVRYFDPEERRPGIPEDVAALVDEMTADETGLSLVNLNQLQSRTVVVQGGAYGEHQVVSVRVGRKSATVNDRSFTVWLAPGSGAHLSIKMKRYANPPTFTLPWA